MISREAAEGILRIYKDRTPNDAEKQEQAELTKAVAEMNKVGREVTPIIFSLDRPAALPDLLDSNATVDFDLAGDGRGEKWPWVKPATAILCWDPGRTGQIRSGRQLFGSATFWMFFADGYQAMAALDDNNDGVLCGRELDGLAVWHDRNSNGRSDSGEVQPAASAGIAKIAVRAATERDGTKHNPAGLTLTTGQTLPTFDWTPTSRP